MSPEPYGKKALLAALRLTGKKLDWPGPVEIVIAGGAAGMFLGIWAADRVTEDCDIVNINPPTQPRRALLQAGREAAEELDLDPDWLNDDFMTFGTLDTLPDGWQTRCVNVGTFGKLKVTSLGRQDLLAMKLHAGREQDILDIRAQLESLTRDDIAFMRAYLDSLKGPWRKHIKPAQLARAFALLAEIEKEVSP
ncbi:MAG: hypothetical protein NTV86_06330 [Planctomycetota bacterium]|nr:hypothetical protein [Planctomycetota bacterium]